MSWCQQPRRFRLALVAVNLSGGLVIGWTFLQAYYWYVHQNYPEWMKSIQFFLSAGSLYRQRFVGFTLEPSWLAHQLNLLYLPWWFAASISGVTVHERRLRWLTAERALFIFGCAALYLTLSRVGLAAFAFPVIFYLVWQIFQRIQAPKLSNPKKSWLFWIVTILMIPLVLLFLLWTLTKLDYRMAELFSLSFVGRQGPIMYLAQKLSLASRFVYWEAGWQVFNQFPLLGVGLGHAGLFLPDALSPFALQLVEVRRLLFQTETLLNIKSLWIRLLAETGIVGFIVFLVWILNSWGISRQSVRSNSAFLRAIGWFGSFIILAFALEGFSLDTFALPYLWVGLGIVGGVALSSEKNDDSTCIPQDGS